MAKVFVQFSDDKKNQIIAVFAGEQDSSIYPNQGEVDTDSEIYKSYVSSVSSISPEMARFLPS